MDFYKYYLRNKTFITETDNRIKKVIELVRENNPSSVLDVGCGDGFLLKNLKLEFPNIKLHGIDVYKTNIEGVEIKRADITNGFPYNDNSFDLLVMGEVIEHLPDPDFILREIRRILKKKGILIVTTPNLVSWANRILILFGIQPFFTETSTEKNLGRYLKILGRGGKVQGHLRIFTYKSLEEILEKENFKVKKRYGTTFFFPFPISLVDLFFSKIVFLSSGLIYVSENNKSTKRK